MKNNFKRIINEFGSGNVINSQFKCWLNKDFLNCTRQGNSKTNFPLLETLLRCTGTTLSSIDFAGTKHEHQTRFTLKMSLPFGGKKINKLEQENQFSANNTKIGCASLTPPWTNCAARRSLFHMKNIIVAHTVMSTTNEYRKIWLEPCSNYGNRFVNDRFSHCL